MRASGVFDFSQRLKSNYSGYSKSMKLTGSDGRNSAAGVSGAYPVSTSRLPMIASGGVPVAEIIKTRLRRSVGKVKTTEILARDKGRGVKIADQAHSREHLVFRSSLPWQLSGVSEKERSLRQTASLFPDRSAPSFSLLRTGR